MTDLNTLLEDVSRLINTDAPSLADARVKMVELDDFVHSPEFESLSYSDRGRFQTAYKELRDCIRVLENPASAANPAAPSFQTSLGGASGQAQQGVAPVDAPETSEAPSHNPYAEQQMEEAEKLFYGGRYAEAIKIYDQVLQIEPKWERARQHRNESENYLRTGYIPSVALPAEAASAFGKAQSAARLGRYADAMSLLSRAQMALRDMGIQRWQDGQEFELKLQQYIDAESVYSEGLQLFAQGMIDDAIERLEASAQATGLPKYNDRVQEMRRAKAAMQTIAEALNSAQSDPKVVVQIKADLDALTLQFGDNPAFKKLKERLQTIIPTIVEPLKDQVRSLINQADRAQTLDAVLAKARQARQALDQARNLGYSDESINNLQTDVEKLFRDEQRYEDEIQQAITVFNSNQSWPVAAWQISQDVRARYPNDPRVIELNRSLAPYRNLRLGIKVGGIILGGAIVLAILFAGFNGVRSYILSLTPTATSTPTATATWTPIPPTPTNTPRPTLTPTITPTASLTPTPLTGVVARDVYVRSGCYETFRAIGLVPAGSTVRFLPAERRFDTLGRECLLVDFTAPDNTSVLGWMLIIDLQ
jgi:tetratricopeptide (TPR) repeat protein